MDFPQSLDLLAKQPNRRNKPPIENCIIRDGKWHGVLLTGYEACHSVNNCQITDNDNDGINCCDAAGLHATNCIITGNGTDGICLSNGDNKIIGCLSAGNGEDGIDCEAWSRPLQTYPATDIQQCPCLEPYAAVVKLF